MAPTASFTTKKINPTTFVIREDDAFGEHPLIYVKVHPKVPLVIVSDTGCDEPSEEHKDGMYSSSKSCLFSKGRRPFPFFRPVRVQVKVVEVPLPTMRKLQMSVPAMGLYLSTDTRFHRFYCCEVHSFGTF